MIGSAETADFMVISVGRVGTISVYSEINRHPDLRVFLTENWHDQRVGVERRSAGHRRLGIMCHQVREFGGPEGVARLADQTARQAVVHFVRDPLVHVRARYNQAVWDTAYVVAFDEQVEGRLGLVPP